MQFITKIAFLILIVAMSTSSALALVPSDPLYGEQEYLQQINVPAAWDHAQGEGVIVAVLDSGVDITHPDLVNQIWRNDNEIADDGIDNDNNGYIDDIHGWDFVRSDNNPRPDVNEHYEIGSFSHGTETAGLIAAAANNHEGIAGVAWRSKIMPVRILSGDGSGTVTRLVTAIEYAVNNGADIINLSLVGYEYSPELKKTVAWAYDHGVIVVAAAGNTTDSSSRRNLNKAKAYPVCYGVNGDDNIVVGVAAVDRQNTLSSFSNYGSNCVDVAAPGESIISLNYFDPALPDFSNLYRRQLSGTSFATALVSGVAALLKSYQPDLTPQEVITALRDSAHSFDDIKGDLGGGVVDANNALSLVPGGQPGGLVQLAGNSAVYYVNGSSKHLFSNEKTFWTWFSGTWANNPVKTVSQSEFDMLTTGANVIARAGSLVKFDNSPKVYVVGQNGMLYNITEDAAKAWYGNDYSTKVNTIQSSFEANYTKSTAVLSSSDKVANGTLVKYAGSDTVYLIWDGKKHTVTAEGFTANKFKDSMVITIPASMTFDSGDSIGYFSRNISTYLP